MEDDMTVSITMSRLKELEAIEQSLPTLIKNALDAHYKEKLKKLHEKDKQNPDAVKLRVKRYNEKHKEEIRKKAREKHQLEKEKEKEREMEREKENENGVNKLENTVSIEKDKTVEKRKPRTKNIKCSSVENLPKNINLLVVDFTT
jgi:hypothetical protein